MEHKYIILRSKEKPLWTHTGHTDPPINGADNHKIGKYLSKVYLQSAFHRHKVVSNSKSKNQEMGKRKAVSKTKIKQEKTSLHSKADSN